MDLSRLSDDDFNALKAGNLQAMSDAGFSELLKEQEKSTPLAVKTARTVEKDRKEYSPTVGMSGPALYLAGLGKSLSDLGTAGMQAVGMRSRSDVDQMRALDVPLMGTGAGKAGFITGTAAQAVPAAMAPGGQSILGAILYGGALGAASPVGTGDSVVKNAALGAGGAAAGYGGAQMLASMLAPKVPKAAQSLIDEGALLTPGQRMGGAWKRAEDAATSIPVTGDFIRNAQRAAVIDFNRAVANMALEPIGGSLPNGVSGRKAVEYVGKALGDAYDSALSRIGTIQADQAFMAELKALESMVAQSTMPKEVQTQFKNAIRSQVRGKLQGQQAMTAQTFKDAESELGRLAARYGADSSTDKQLLGDALTEAQAALRRLLERAAGPEHAADVAATNRGWSEFVRMQRAAGMQGSRDGVFSPEAYMSSVRAMDKSVRKGGFARGAAIGQDIGEDALRTLGATVPDSGTPFRTLVANPIQGLLNVAATAPVAAAYSSPAFQRAAQGLLSGRRPALATKAAAELEMMAPALSALGISGANIYLRSGDR